MSNGFDVQETTPSGAGDPNTERLRKTGGLTANPAPEDLRRPGQGSGTGPDGSAVSTLIPPSPTALNYRRSLFRR